MTSRLRGPGPPSLRGREEKRCTKEKARAASRTMSGCSSMRRAALAPMALICAPGDTQARSKTGVDDFVAVTMMSAPLTAARASLAG